MKNQANPKVSVCIPIYNVSKYIEQCLRSVFSQTIANTCEFILVNDCTPDDSMQIAERVISDYPALTDKIKIIAMQKNMGLAAARKTAMQNVSGEYVIHVDSDDWCEPDYLEKMYTAAVANDADVVIIDCFIHRGDEIFVERHPSPLATGYEQANLSYIDALFQDKMVVPIWAKMVRTNLYIENNISWKEGINKGEDFLISVKIFYFSKKIIHIDLPLYHYRASIGFITKVKKTDRYRMDARTQNELEKFFIEQNILEVFKKQLALKKAEAVYGYILCSPVFNIKKYKEAKSLHKYTGRGCLCYTKNQNTKAS